MSLWCYIEAIPPNTSNSFDKYTSVFNYGDKPNILYKTSNNTMMITVKLKDLTEELIKKSHFDIYENDNVIIYKKENVLLQKWNNIILNYTGGTLDIFYNGELVKSVNNVVPYMSLDQVTTGEVGGINAYICNVVYYKEPLNFNQIQSLYNSVKDTTPPVLSILTSNDDMIKENTKV